MRGKNSKSSTKLVCSIPVLKTRDKIFVDCLALPRGEGCLYSHPWTHIYSPTRADQVIGNSSSCSSILHWLHCWKKKCESKHYSTPVPDKQNGKTLQKKFNTNSDPDYIMPSDPGCDENSSALLLYGPHGSGKTAAVYACAAQVGFKVK